MIDKKGRTPYISALLAVKNEEHRLHIDSTNQLHFRTDS
jgi:hypothetical protein